MSITRTLARLFSDYYRPESLVSKLRSKRIAPLLEMVEETHNVYGYVNIIDIGGTEEYWGIVPRDYLRLRNVTITIVNLPDPEMPMDHGPFKFRSGDGCNLFNIGDRSFHIAHSNSVLEHVGDWGRMRKFAKELKRISEKWFIQTPNYWFPIEPHCMVPLFQWLPKPARLWLVLHFQLGHWDRGQTVEEAMYIVESARLLNKKMLQALFPEAQVTTERFFGLPKSFIVATK